MQALEIPTIAADRLNQIYPGNPVELIRLVPNGSINSVIASQLWLGSLSPKAGYQLIEQFERVLVADGWVLCYMLSGSQETFFANAWSFCLQQFQLAGWQGYSLLCGHYGLVVLHRGAVGLLPTVRPSGNFYELLVNSFCPEGGVILAPDCHSQLMQQSKKSGRWMIGFEGGEP